MPYLMKGALIEYGSDFFGPIPNIVIFQFNPENLQRNIEIPDRPTGATSRETSQAGEAQETVTYQSKDPYASGWGWWYFGSSRVYDDHISWSAEYLPAGTYELTYTLVVLQPGDFQVRPAQAWQIYFPEVQGISAGALFEVLP